MPKLWKKVSDKAEKCPHCNCDKEALRSAQSDLSQCATESAEAEPIKMSLAGYSLEFDRKREEYFNLRRYYEKQACLLREKVSNYYDSTKNFKAIIENVSSLILPVMEETIENSTKFLYERGIPMTPEMFLKKYYNNYNYNMDYSEIISKVVEKYAEVVDEKASLENYRSMQKASRSQWQGGGFGIQGAVKGAIMAGALNAGTNFVRSFGDASQKRADNEFIEKKLRELKSSDYTCGQIIGGAYSVIIAVFEAVLNELREHNHVMSGYTSKAYDTAKKICDASERYETDSSKKVEGYLDSILAYPYYAKPYRLIYETICNTSKESQVFKVMHYFGVELKLGGISASEYIEIENYINGARELQQVDYSKNIPEQFYIVSKVISDLQKNHDEQMLMKHWTYRKLNEYVHNTSTEETFSYDSPEEKNQPLIKYIPELIRKCQKMGYIEEKAFDGFLWVKDVNAGCDYDDNIETFNYAKYLSKSDQYLLIYENTTLHMGKRGFGIFEDGIVFFDTKERVQFKDIENCIFNSSKISLLIKRKKGTYEFQYNFFGQKMLAFLGKEQYVALGECLTDIICKIIKHYQELNGIGK